MSRQELDRSTQWSNRWRIGRLQVGYCTYRHRSPRVSDRWVFKPYAIYDRKTRR